MISEHSGLHLKPRCLNTDIPALEPTPRVSAERRGRLRCRNNPAPFTFVLNLIVPGPPWRNLVMSWSADYNPAGGVSQPRGTPKSSVAGRYDTAEP